MCRFSLLIIFLFSLQLEAQEHLIVENIIYQGNKRTKTRIIDRELSFQPGDSIPITDLSKVIEENADRLKGIGLFNTVTISSSNNSGGRTDMTVEVIENWYIYAVPIFELADRNFNVWWQEQGKSLKRTNYGVRLRHYNFTGNKDPLKITLHAGYTRKAEIEYTFPYFSDNSNLRIYTSVFYADNKEIPYATVANKSVFYQHEDERIMLRRFRASIQARLRPDVLQHHSWSLEFHRNWIDEIVANDLNPSYFLEDRQVLRFFMINYDYQFDKRDYYLYPRKGYRLFGNIKKEGLGIFKDQNSILLSAGVESFLAITEKYAIGTKLSGKTNLIRSQQSFANNTGLGWSDDLVSGYELYVMDGIDHVLLQSQMKWEVFNKDLPINRPKFIPGQFRNMNISINFRFNFDTAYVNDPVYIESNTLNNRWIFGFGPALDIILYNSFLYSIEYSINDIGERGLFFKANNSF